MRAEPNDVRSGQERGSPEGIDAPDPQSGERAPVEPVDQGELPADPVILYWKYMLKGYEWFPKHNTAFRNPSQDKLVVRFGSAPVRFDFDPANGRNRRKAVARTRLGIVRSQTHSRR